MEEEEERKEEEEGVEGGDSGFSLSAVWWILASQGEDSLLLKKQVEFRLKQSRCRKPIFPPGCFQSH